VTSLVTKDAGPIQSFVLFVAVMYVLVNLSVDLLYGLATRAFACADALAPARPQPAFFRGARRDPRRHRRGPAGAVAGALRSRRADAAAALASVSVRHPLGTDLYGVTSSRGSSTPARRPAGRPERHGHRAHPRRRSRRGGRLPGRLGGPPRHARGGRGDGVPAFILALAITAALGNSTANVVAAIALTHVPIYTRLIRGEMLRRGKRSTRRRRARWATAHTRSSSTPVSELCAAAHRAGHAGMGFAILTVAALSFIGLGIQPPQSEWGQMTAEGAGYVVSGSGGSCSSPASPSC